MASRDYDLVNKTFFILALPCNISDTILFWVCSQNYYLTASSGSTEGRQWWGGSGSEDLDEWGKLG